MIDGVNYPDGYEKMGSNQQQKVKARMEKEEEKLQLLEESVGQRLQLHLGINRGIEAFERDLDKQSKIFFNELVVKDKESSSSEESDGQTAIDKLKEKQ